MKKLLIFLVVLLSIAAIGLTAFYAVMNTAMDFSWIDQLFSFEKEYKITVVCKEGGSVNINEGRFKSGEQIELVATADEGYVFAGWYNSDSENISTSSNYLYTVEQNEKLFAHFSRVIKEIDGGGAESVTVIRDCDQYFSFDVYCQGEDGEKYISDNLIILDAYYRDDENYKKYAVEYKVTDRGNGAFSIQPRDGIKYAEGVTYTVRLSDADLKSGRIKFADERFKESGEMDFTVKKEEKEVIKVKDGVVTIVFSDGKDNMVSSLNDYDMLLKEKYGIKTGDVFYLDNKNSEEDSFYGKVSSISKSGSGYKIKFGSPKVEEVFKELDVNKKVEVDFTKNARVTFSNDVYNQVKKAVLSNESVIKMIAVGEKSVSQALMGTGLSAAKINGRNINDLLNIKCEAREDGKNIVLDITVEMTYPVNNGGQNAGGVKLVMNINDTISFDGRSNVVMDKNKGLSFDIGMGIVRKESTEFYFICDIDNEYDINTVDKSSVMAEIEKISASVVKNGRIEECTNLNKIKNAIVSWGFDPSFSNKSINIGTVIFTDGNTKYESNVEYCLSIQFGGSCTVKMELEQDSVVGIRKTSGGIDSYCSSAVSGKIPEAFFIGKNEIDTCLIIVSRITMPKISSDLKLDLTSEFNMGVMTSGALSKGNYAGNLTVYQSYSVEGKREDDGNMYTDKVERIKTPVLEYGNPSVILGFSSILNGSLGKIEFSNKEYPLVESGLLDFKIIDLKSGKKSDKKWVIEADGYEITIDFANGEFIRYENGKLIVADNAPDSFKDKMIVKIICPNIWDKANADGYWSYVNEAQIDISYGKDKDYAVFDDSPIKSHFRLLYRSYTPGDSSVLYDTFNKLIESYDISVADQYMSVYRMIVMDYLEISFEVMGEYHAEADAVKAENEFVENEAEIFKIVIDFMKEVSENKDIDTAHMHELLDAVVNSRAMYNTLIKVAKDDDVSILAESFAKVDKEIKDRIDSGLADYIDKNSSNERAMNVVNAFKTILDLK